MPGRYLKQADRIKIEKLYSEGEKPLAIAEKIQVRHSTIYRELKKGYTGATDKNGRPGYSAAISEERAKKIKVQRTYAPKKYSDLQLLKWRLLHPYGKPAHCSRDIGISKTALSYRFPEIYCTAENFYTELKNYVESLSAEKKQEILERKEIYGDVYQAPKVISAAVARSHPEAPALLEEPEVFASIWNEYKTAQDKVLAEISNEIESFRQFNYPKVTEELQQILFEARLQQFSTYIKIGKALGSNSLVGSEKAKYESLKVKIQNKGLEQEYLIWKERHLRENPMLALELAEADEGA